MRRPKALSISLGLLLAMAGASAYAEPAAPEADQGAPEQAGAPTEQGDKENARLHYQLGVKDYEAGRFKDAIDHFLEANRLAPSPALSFNIARAYDKLGDTAGTLAFYRDYLRRAPDADDREKVKELISKFEQKLREKGVQQVTVLSEPEHATVVLDGKPVGVTPWTGEVFPGKHRMVLRMPGFEEAEEVFELPAHRAIDVEVKLTAKPLKEPAPPEPRPAPVRVEAVAPKDEGAPRAISPWTWLSFGVGAGALVGALGFEFARASAEEDAHNARRQTEAQDEYDTMEGRQSAARVLLGVGIVATAVGGTLLYFDLSSSSSPEASARLGVGCTKGLCGLAAAGEF